ncbi:MAG TPA: hypothetical protein VGB83_04690 [Actinomycetota bacterium]
MKHRRRTAALRLSSAFACALIAVGAIAVPAVAKPPVADAGTLSLRLPRGVSDEGPNGDLIMDSQDRRAYQFMFSDLGFTTGRIWDLDSRRVAKEVKFPTEYFPQGPLAPTSRLNSREWVHALDAVGDRLFIPYLSGGIFAGINVFDTRTLGLIDQFPYPRVTYEPNPDNLGCTSNNCLPQAPTVQPKPVALSFVEPILTGLTPKVLVLMEEPKGPLMERNFNVAWIAQIDAATGRQDWIYRISSCGATLPGRGDGYFQLGMFQAQLGTGIYVTCLAAGGTGQVVRLVVDANNVPQAEQAFPGPIGVVDALTDPGSDRMVIRVANEQGESWWIFDGPSASYTGVVGGTVSPAQITAGIDQSSGRLYMQAPATKSGPIGSPGGLMMSDIRRSPAPQFLGFPEYARKGRGTIRVDVHPATGRRLVYLRGEGTDYQIVEDNEPISYDPPISNQDAQTIDVEEEAGVTSADFTGSGHAYGFRMLLVGGLGGVPPTGPDVNALRVGSYGPFILGSPCGRGDRELVAGSVKSVGLSNNLASASAVVSEADPGSTTDVGEPTARCYPRPRDPGGNDLWELSRAPADYPEPFRTEVDDDPDDTKTDSDEVLGSDWPFSTVECGGDDEASTSTTLTPLRRGDPDTDTFEDETLNEAFESARATTIPLDRFSAAVTCGQSMGSASASSQVLGAETGPPAITADPDSAAVEIPIPGIGTLRIAEVSASTVIYRDPERGLVSRSVAVARGISIGDHVFIDSASTIAEAVAAGRPGTASTEFIRRVCGVRIKDEAPDVHVFRPGAEPDQEKLLAGDVEGGLEVEPEGGGEQEKSVDEEACADITTPAGGQTISIIGRINQALGTRGRITTPEPDSDLRHGSPGGYIASIQKDRKLEISSRAVNNDASTQVPALELIVFNDDPTLGRGRQVIQLAGVDASVTYGIYLLDPGDDFNDLPRNLIDYTGGFPDPAPPPAYVPPTTPPAANGPITMLFEGISFLFRSPKDALLAGLVWAMLYAPFQLGLRRRALKGLA